MKPGNLGNLGKTIWDSLKKDETFKGVFSFGVFGFLLPTNSLIAPFQTTNIFCFLVHLTNPKESNSFDGQDLERLVVHRSVEKWICETRVFPMQKAAPKTLKPGTSKHPVFNGCFNWMIPNHYIKNGWKSPNIHQKNGCFGYTKTSFVDNLPGLATNRSTVGSPRMGWWHTFILSLFRTIFEMPSQTGEQKNGRFVGWETEATLTFGHFVVNCPVQNRVPPWTTPWPRWVCCEEEDFWVGKKTWAILAQAAWLDI